MGAKITWKNRKRAVRDLAYAYIWEWHDGTGDVEFAGEIVLNRSAAFTTGSVKPSNRPRILKALHRDAKIYAKENYSILMQIKHGL